MQPKITPRSECDLAAGPLLRKLCKLRAYTAIAAGFKSVMWGIMEGLWGWEWEVGETVFV